MFVLKAEKNVLTLREKEAVTSGSVNVFRAQFQFSQDWDGLDRIAVFKSGRKIFSAVLDQSNTCVIPWEVLKISGSTLQCGVYGTRDGSIVLPTIWCGLGWILPGAAPGDDAQPPTPDLWEQELARRGDALEYDGLTLSLMSGDKPLSSVKIAGGGEGGIAYRFGHGLKQNGLDVSLDMSSDENPDKTLPISAAEVNTIVGNIEILLKSI